MDALYQENGNFFALLGGSGGVDLVPVHWFCFPLLYLLARSAASVF